MKLKEYRMNITTAADGTASVTVGPVYGKLDMVYVNDGTLADNWDITLSWTDCTADSHTLLTLTNKSADTTVYVRHQVHGNDGTALTLDGTRIAFDRPAVAGKVTAAVTDGGATKSGQVLLYVLV